ncbi:MAG TPA: Rrf2 family transcriptional regulator [Bacteroidales bacterium]|nr:Rrf2 family transcriptional regulator [Bacteroidales bacterium]HOE05564.1 Rrf2 family transcriptional regulator [Bacteroidales bacterium]HQL70366.1 Rrf2 family transcriptional regulator [Bacteroidales bacterium]
MSKVIAISEAVGIALHSMALVSRSRHPLNATQITEITGSSKHHIAKVLQRLVKAGLLKSSRGPAGGFWLNKNPENITLLDIYEAIEGKLELGACPLDYRECVMGQCILECIASSIGKNFEQHMRSTNLGDVNKLNFKPFNLQS